MALASPSLPSPPPALPADLAGSVRPISLAGGRVLPVLPALAGLLPEGGLRRGSTVAVGAGARATGAGPGAGAVAAGAVVAGASDAVAGAGAGVSGGTSLALALLAGPSAAGSWCAVVGVPTLGLAAAAELGVDPGRLAVVPAPGRDWAAVVAALLDGLDVVAVRPPGRWVRPGDARRLAARARERGAVLVALGRWEGADVRLSVAASSWAGVERGAGHLSARLVEVAAEGRGAAARPRSARLWLPSADGRVVAADAGAASGRRLGVVQEAPR